MKSIYFVFLFLITFNLLAQTRIVKLNTANYQKSSLVNRQLQTKKVQEEIDSQSMTSALIGKAILPSQYRFKSKNLKLNGAGLREMLWIDLYACGLYLPEKNSVASKIVSSNEAMVIRLDILSNAISKNKLIKAFEKGFEKANTEKATEIYKKELAEFISFLDVKIQVGDKYDIVYTPGVGTTLYVNYKKKGTVEGLSFKSAIFNIWLSDIEPADKSLKRELLGNI